MGNIINRTFIPGSEWLYLKLYTGAKTADNILKHELYGYISDLIHNDIINKWFFIRYYDSEFHIRLRIHLKETQSFNYIFNHFFEICDSLIKTGLVWNIQCDTYNRELERYGEHLIEEAESIFCADSECILSILRILNGNDNYRWMIALKLIDELLSDFELDIGEKQKLMKTLSKSCKTEFGFNENNSKQFNSKFRENKKNIEAVLNNTIYEKDFISLYQPIEKRKKILIPIVKQIKSKLIMGEEMNELLNSYLHMMLNRLFRSKNRIHEMVLYDFIFRYYTSEIAKQKYHPNTYNSA